MIWILTVCFYRHGDCHQLTCIYMGLCNHDRKSSLSQGFHLNTCLESQAQVVPDTVMFDSSFSVIILVENFGFYSYLFKFSLCVTSFCSSFFFRVIYIRVVLSLILRSSFLNGFYFSKIHSSILALSEILSSILYSFLYLKKYTSPVPSSVSLWFIYTRHYVLLCAYL